MAELVQVTQADRDAAADLLEGGGSKGILCRFDHAITIRHSENLDGDPFVQAFATHRLTALSDRDVVLEEAAKVVERRRDQRFEEHGIREPDTNATYYSGSAAETYEALDEEDEEIAQAIRALKGGVDE